MGKQTQAKKRERKGMLFSQHRSGTNQRKGGGEGRGNDFRGKDVGCGRGVRERPMIMGKGQGGGKRSRKDLWARLTGLKRTVKKIRIKKTPEKNVIVFWGKKKRGGKETGGVRALPTQQSKR